MVPASGGRAGARAAGRHANPTATIPDASGPRTVALSDLMPKIVRVNLFRRHPIALGLIALVLVSALAPLPALVDAVSGAPPPDADLIRPALYTLFAPASDVLDALTFLSLERARAFLLVWVSGIALGAVTLIDRAAYNSDTHGMLGLFAELHRSGAIGIASLPEYWLHHWEDLDQFVSAGVDGFEIVNCAPKAIGVPATARARVLRLAEDHDL